MNHIKQIQYMVGKTQMFNLGTKNTRICLICLNFGAYFVFLHVFGFFLQIPFACRFLLLFMVAASCSRHSKGLLFLFTTSTAAYPGFPRGTSTQGANLFLATILKETA